MKASRTRRWISALLLCCSALVSLNSMGCQTTIGGQTLPSPNYLKDDVQYFPPGPETQLPRTRQAHNEYRALEAAEGLH
jgi:hypothetical protein